MAPTAPVIMEHHRGREELHADTATLSIGYISHSAGKSDACSAWSATRSDPASMIGGSKDGILPGGNRDAWRATPNDDTRSEEPTSELQSLMRISYACLFLTTNTTHNIREHHVKYRSTR